MFTPKKNLTAKGQNCSSGKKAKDRLTLVACTSMDGGGREASHHWKIGETQMFQKIAKISFLPVTNTDNSKARMTSDLFKKNWSKEINHKMGR